MSSKKFIQFLKKLHKDAKQPILVITDNARYHHSKEKQKEIILEFIPPYSLELNPDEQVWNHLKLRLGKISIFSKEEMKSGVLSIMRSIQKKVSLIQSFFKMKDTKYIVKAMIA